MNPFKFEFSLFLLLLLVHVKSISSKVVFKRPDTEVVIRRPNAKPVIKRPQPLKSKTTRSEFAVPFLHKERKYDFQYLRKYKKMIQNLLPEDSMYSQFGSREFLVREGESKTDMSRYSQVKAQLPVCSPEEQKEWKKVKVLQLEDSNSVTLKEHRRTGVKMVEKSMEVRKHYDKELAFFRHANHGSKSYFPAFVCSAKPSKSSKGQYLIVTDYVEGENSHVMAAKASSDQLRYMVAQFFNSVVEMHKVGFIHCDLTPANVMVSADFEVKLIDFGMAMPIGTATGRRGSVYTRAPELNAMVPGEIDVAIDWWAFGCTVAIWYYYHYNPEDLKLNDYRYEFTPMLMGSSRILTFKIPEQFSRELRTFLSMFLTLDPELRTFSTERLQNLVKSHEFFSGFDWSTAEKN